MSNLRCLYRLKIGQAEPLAQNRNNGLREAVTVLMQPHSGCPDLVGNETKFRNVFNVGISVVGQCKRLAFLPNRTTSLSAISQPSV